MISTSKARGLLPHTMSELRQKIYDEVNTKKVIFLRLILSVNHCGGEENRLQSRDM